MLTAIPEKAVASFRDCRTIGDWLRDGAFTVTACGKDEVVLETSPEDYGAILLTECENLLNHCLEHIQEMICIGNDTRVRSQAWAVVTAYYFGFFAAGALLRLVGEPVVFLTTEQLKKLQSLASAASKPGQGALQFEITKQISVTRVEINLRKTEKVHEATWKRALGLLDQLNRDPSLPKSTFETLLYDSVCSNVLFRYYNSFQWPSMVRNHANYRPGFIYQLHNTSLNFPKLFKPWRTAPATDIHRIIESCLDRCGANHDEFAHHADVMVNVSSVLFLLARALYADLLSRRSTDRRWEQQREHYRKKLNIPNSDYELLLAPA